MSEKPPHSQEPENSEDGEDPSYEVGYGKPPAHAQFKKGKSGNKSGRPKGSKNKPKDISSTLNDIVLKEASRTFKAQEDGRTRDITMMEGVIKSIFINSVKGNPRSQRLLVPLVIDAEKFVAEQKQETFELAMSFKL